MWPRLTSSSTHKGKERLVALDAKLGPKDVMSVVSDAQYSQCPQTTDASDIDWPFLDISILRSRTKSRPLFNMMSGRGLGRRPERRLALALEHESNSMV